jgi:hypothetical protein
MDVFLYMERVGDDLYVGVAHDAHGQKLIEVGEPLPYLELLDAMKAAGAIPGNDLLDIDNAFYEADQRPNDGLSQDRRYFYELRVRAYSGLGSESDASWLIDELDNPRSIHPVTALLGALSAMGPQHEAVVSPYLEHDDPFVAHFAMRDLIKMGLADKYADSLIQWMHTTPPPDPYKRAWSRGNHSYGIAAQAFKKSRNPNILRALIQAAEDTNEKWTTRKNAIWCLSVAIDALDQISELGNWVSADDSRMQGVIRQA